MKRYLPLYATAGALVMMAPAAALAQTAAGAGASTLEMVNDLFLGNTGMIVGLGLSAYGFWKWLIDQSSWGIMTIIGGVIITAFPGTFMSVQHFVYDVIPGITYTGQ